MCGKNSVSVLNAFAFAALIVAGLACCLSFVAPFWIVYPDRPGVPNISHTVDMADRPRPAYPFARATWRGLCAVCFKDAAYVQQLSGQEPNSNPVCVWFVEDDFAVQKSLPDWYLATQCLFAAGLALLLMALFSESFYACCGCCQRRSCLPTFVGSLTVAAGILVAASLALFAGFSCSEQELSSEDKGGQAGNLWWAFYVGMAGALVAILSAILFYCDGCRLANIYYHYKPPSVTDKV